jgi:hypothetical protein
MVVNDLLPIAESNYLVPPHEVRDPMLAGYLYSTLRDQGWSGPLLVVEKCCHGLISWTGSHRIWALQQLKLAVEKQKIAPKCLDIPIVYEDHNVVRCVAHFFGHHNTSFFNNQPSDICGLLVLSIAGMGNSIAAHCLHHDIKTSTFHLRLVNSYYQQILRNQHLFNCPNDISLSILCDFLASQRLRDIMADTIDPWKITNSTLLQWEQTPPLNKKDFERTLWTMK